jgi:hypothetical protein
MLDLLLREAAVELQREAVQKSGGNFEFGDAVGDVV